MTNLFPLFAILLGNRPWYATLGNELNSANNVLHCKLSLHPKSGEELEYDVEQGHDGRLKASNVTGPKGQHCQGTPQQGRGGGAGGGGRGGGGRGGYGGGRGGYGGGGGGYGGGGRGGGGYGGGQGGYGGGGYGGAGGYGGGGYGGGGQGGGYY